MRWVRQAGEHGQAGRHHCVCTEWSVAWAASSSPEIRARAGVCRGRWIDGDGWSARHRGMGGRFAYLVLVVMEEKQTDLTVTNEPSLLLPDFFIPFETPLRTFRLMLCSQNHLHTSSLRFHRDSAPVQMHLLFNFNFEFRGLPNIQLVVYLKQHLVTW